MIGEKASAERDRIMPPDHHIPQQEDERKCHRGFFRAEREQMGHDRPCQVEPSDRAIIVPLRRLDVEEECQEIEKCHET